MNRKEHILTKVAEEAVEVAQRATKALSFGLNEVQEGQELTNAQRLIYEFNDLVGVMNMLYNEQHIPYVFDHLMQQEKIKKVEKYLLHSKAQGTLHEHAVDNWPKSKEEQVNWFRSNILRMLDAKQMSSIKDWLGTYQSPENKPDPKVETVSPEY